MAIFPLWWRGDFRKSTCSLTYFRCSIIYRFNVDPRNKRLSLTTETIKSWALALECVHNIHGSSQLSISAWCEKPERTARKHRESRACFYFWLLLLLARVFRLCLEDIPWDCLWGRKIIEKWWTRREGQLEGGSAKAGRWWCLAACSWALAQGSENKQKTLSWDLPLRQCTTKLLSWDLLVCSQKNVGAVS